MDSHCHLNCWTNTERTPLLQRAWESGLQILITVAVSLSRLEILQQLSQTWNKKIFFTAGIHPTELPPSLTTLAIELENVLINSTPIAIGETGLDFTKTSNPLHHIDRQEEALAVHIAIAKAANLPLILHCRDKAKETLAWKKLNQQITQQKFPREKALIHCFSYSIEELRYWQGEGGWISFAGNITYSPSIAAACQICEKNQMLFETDAPFLLPKPLHRETPDQRNEPAFLHFIFEKVAQLHSTSVEVMRALSLENGCRFFGISHD